MSEKSLRWYHSLWRVLVAGFLGVVVILAVVYGILVFRYTKIIKSGAGAGLTEALNDSFSALPGVAQNVKAVNRAELEVSTAPILGNQNAPLTIVEFVDYKCPNCRLAAPIISAVVNANSQKVKLLVRHFPIESTHPGASRLSLFAECANRQGVFWPAYNLLYARQDSLSAELTAAEIAELSAVLNLNVTQMNACLSGQAANLAVTRDYGAALTFGVRGTPTWFVNGQKIEGVLTAEVWQKIIDSFSNKK